MTNDEFRMTKEARNLNDENRQSVVRSEFFLGREGQAPFTFEKFFQSPVFGTVFAAKNSWRDKLAAFAARAATFQPIFVADRAFNRDAGDF